MAKTWTPGITHETIRLSSEAKWLSNGEEITHGPTCQAFFRSIKKAEDGSYFLEIGSNRKGIEVEDTAYFVKSLDGDRQSGFVAQISDGTQEKLRPETLRYQQGRLTCLIKNGEFEARFLRAPYHAFLAQTEQDKQGYFIKVGNKVVRLETLL